MTEHIIETTTAFTAAPPGWHVLYYPRERGQNPTMVALAGWLTVEYRKSVGADRLITPEIVRIETVAAIHRGARVVRADPPELAFWKILAPGQRNPGPGHSDIEEYFDAQGAP